MRSMTWIVVYALVIGANVSTAQVPATSLVAGELVQYELARPLDDLPEESRGTFQTLTPSVVMLSEVEDFSVPGPVELPRELIADFEVARGTKDIRWPGAVVVGAAGCLAGYAMAERSSAEDGELLGTFLGCPIGLLVGGILGYFVGSQITGPRWVDVDLN